MKHSNLSKIILTSLLSIWMFSAIQSQVTEVTFYAEADLSLGDGTGGDIGDAKIRNFGSGGSIMVTNFDDYVGYMSPFEGWVKFDLTTLADSIPDGETILYAEILMMVSNNTGNGYYCYHLKDIDEWAEGNGSSSSLDETGEGLTWTSAQELDYENSENYTLIHSDPNAPGTGSTISFEVTSAVEYEMGESGNGLLTLRFYPTIDDPEAAKRWLGLYAREAPWGTVMENGINAAAPHIIFYVGPEQPTEFSDIENFGDIGNYNITPAGFQQWIVGDDEGDDRLIINGRPAPINSTPGGLAMYNMDTYGDFDISVKAKLNKEKDAALDPKADFIIAFGYEDGKNYSYMRFTGEDINGFYLVDSADGGTVTEVGDLNTTPAVSDMNYHNYRLVRSGSTVTAYIDGTEYMSITDDALGAEGMIGMGSYNDIALFDDFQEGEGIGPGAVNDLSKSRFTIYPNPSDGNLFVDSELYIQKLVVTNLIGKEIMTVNNMRSGVIVLNTSELERGIYFVTAFGPNAKIETRKFIVK